MSGLTVYRAAGDGRAFGLFNGSGLTRKHELVDKALAGNYDAIYRHALPRTHDHVVAGLYVVRDNFGGLAVAHDPRRFRCKPNQAPDGRQRPSLGDGFEVLAGEDERDDACRRFEVRVRRARGKTSGTASTATEYRNAAELPSMTRVLMPGEACRSRQIPSDKSAPPRRAGPVERTRAHRIP